ADSFHGLRWVPVILILAGVACGLVGRLGTILVLLASAAMFALYLRSADWAGPSRWFVHGAQMTGVEPREIGLVWLAPVSCFGFLACPYLDLTFLRARGALRREAARAAFSLGFGAFFLVMILFTAAYSGEFFGRSIAAERGALIFVLVHVLLQ